MNSIGLVKNNVFESSLVTFPWGGVRGESEVLAVARLTHGKAALILAETPFHPVDANWPDQPADFGTIAIPALKTVFEVGDCRIFAVNKSSLDITERVCVARKEQFEWYSVVAHIIDAEEYEIESLVGAQAIAEVDIGRRERLNQHHTACHLAALALNRATHEFWARNGFQADSLGYCDFDKAAMFTSTIHEDRAEDMYRLGKSIRKKGLQVEKLLESLPCIEEKVNLFLQEWISHPSRIVIEAAGGHLDDRRTWRCALPQGDACMPCGGSHLDDISQFKSIDYVINPVHNDEYIKNGESRLLAITRATIS